MEPSGTDDGDAALLARARDGEQAAFHVLVDRHAAGLFRAAMGLAGSRTDAEDLLQETFVAALTGLSSFRGGSSVKTWLTGILIKRAARMHRYRRVRKALSLDGLLGRGGAGSSRATSGRLQTSSPSRGSGNRGSERALGRAIPKEPPGASRGAGGSGGSGSSGGGLSGGGDDAAFLARDGAEAAGTRMDVMAALSSLKTEHRDVLVLREFQELSYQEIAQVLGVPRGTVESRIFRARQALRAALPDYFPDAAPTPPRSPRTPDVRGEEEKT